MKMILVFVNGDLIKMIHYKTKRIAKRHYKNFIKNGICNSYGEVILNAKIELI